MLSFIRSLKSLVRSSDAVAVVTFPPSLVSPTLLKRWQHLADTLLSVRAVPGAFTVLSHQLELLPNCSPLVVKDNANLSLDQMRTRCWQNFSLVIRICLAFSTYTKWHVLTLRFGLNPFHTISICKYAAMSF